MVPSIISKIETYSRQESQEQSKLKIQMLDMMKCLIEKYAVTMPVLKGDV